MTKTIPSAHLNAIRHKRAAKEELERKLVEILAANELLRKEIEERMRAEATLLESEEKYRTLVEQADDGIIIVQDAILQFVNSRMAELLAGTVEFLTGSPITDFIDERDVAKITEMHRRRVTGEKLPSRYEALLRRANGSPVQTELNVAVITYNGKPATQVTVTDITERKQAEQALQASENKLRLFIEHAPAAIAIFDTSMKYLAASSRWLSDYGLGEQDIIGRSHYEVFPETPERWKVIHQRCLAGAIETCEEDPFPRSDGKVDWVRWEVRPWYDKTGSIGGLLMFTEVITERKRVEEEFKKVSQKYRDIFEKVPIGIYHTNSEGRYIAANPAAAKLLGYDSPDDLIASVTDVGTQVYVRTEDRDEAFRRMMDLGIIKNFEAQFRRKDGTIVWGSLNAFPVYDHEGNILYIQGTSEDITKRKVAEESLRKSEEELRRSHDELEQRVQERTIQLRKSEETALKQLSEIEGYYDTAPLGVGILDSQLRYIRVNKRLAKINGIPPEAHIGRTVGEVVSDKAGQWLEKAAPRILESGETIKDVEVRRKALRHRGQMITRAHLFPIKGPNGQAFAIGIIVEDITEKKKLEEELRQSQKMEAIGTLAGGIAHDFNNILAAVLGFGEIALEDTEQPHVEDSLRQVIGAALRGRELVRQILTFSRKTTREKKTVDLRPIISETFNMLRAALPSTITMELSMNAENYTARADVSGIQQIVMNIATNAAQAMPRGGTLSVSVRETKFTSRRLLPEHNLKLGHYLVLSFTDSGIGMDNRVLSRIFEPFFTTKGAGQGTGMGMPVVYGIVKDHGGAIIVESSPGKGSLFTVYLPLIHDETEQEAPIMKPAVSGGHERILFVDDEKSIATIAHQMLSRLGYEVTVLNEPLKALDLFSRDPRAFDLVITDQTMPNFTGLILAKKLLALRPDLPIILSTGYSEAVSPEKLRKAGIRQFLTKPLQRREWAETIRKVLDHQEDS